MFLNNLIKGSNKSTSSAETTEQQPRKGKRVSEEDPKSLMKRAALGDVTNKQEKPKGTTRTRSTRSKKKELEQQSLLCAESATKISQPAPDRMSMDGDDVPIRRVTKLLEKVPPPADEWEVPHVDIDAGDETDPQLCCVYVNDIYSYLRENEVRYHTEDYMQHQKDITPHMRAILVDWLIEVAEEYKLSSETLYLAVSYIDRYLSKKTVMRGKLQLVGVASMLLASKYEEIYAPSVDEFVYISDNTYTKEEVFSMESNVLDTLEFCLTGATIKNFLRRFLKAAGGADVSVTMFANYLCELSLHEYCFTRYLPSVVAASAVCLALHTLHKTPCWTPTLEYYTHLRPTDEVFRKCIGELHQHHKAAPKGALQAVQDKYSQSKFCRVSDHQVIPPVASVPFPL
jgi:cyclin A